MPIMGLIYPLDFDTYDLASMTRSSRGLGHWPFTPATRVRIPYGSPSFFKLAFSRLLYLFEERCAVAGDAVDFFRVHFGQRPIRHPNPWV